jgi:hypothetical protein
MNGQLRADLQRHRQGKLQAGLGTPDNPYRSMLSTICQECLRTWPCDASRALATLDEAAAHDARLTTAAVEAALSDLRRQVRACQPTRTTLAYRQGHDDARGSVFEMIAALLASHPSAVDKEGIE